MPTTLIIPAHGLAHPGMVSPNSKPLAPQELPGWHTFLRNHFDSASLFRQAHVPALQELLSQEVHSGRCTGFVMESVPWRQHYTSGDTASILS